MSRIRSKFKHYALSEISLDLDGRTQPVKPLKPNFANHQYIQSYKRLFSGTVKENRDEGNDIAREDCPNGYALYAYDLNPDLAKKDISTWRSKGTSASN